MKDDASGALVWVGTGIAAYFCFEGRIHRGAHGMNGEVGHLIVEPDGPTCACGRRGCLEAVASIPAIEEAVRRQITYGNASELARQFAGCPESLTIHHILKAAELGDQMAYVALHRAAERLGEAISTMLNVIGPMAVVLGGTLAGSRVVLDTVKRVVMLEVVQTLFPKIDIRAQQAPAEAASYGAALLEIEKLFARPNIPQELLAAWSDIN